MRRTSIGKMLIVLLAVLVVTALSFSVAVAGGQSAEKAAAAANGNGNGGNGDGGGGDGDSKGGPCPPNSKNPGGTPPNCGHGPDEPPVDTCDDGIDNDEDGLTDGDDPECQDPDDGVEDTPDDPPVDTCTDGEDNDGDGATDGDDTECQDPDDGVEDGSGGEPTCGDPDGDGVNHSEFDPDSNEGGLVSSIVHEVDQALPSPLGDDGGVVTEVNCALIVTVEEILGIDG